MKKLLLLFVIALFTFLGLSGCAVTLPTDTYTPQNFVRYQNQNAVDIGQFVYEPSQNGKVQPNQIQSTAVGTILITSNVSDMVRRITALELEKTGVALNDKSPILVSGNILEFKADDLGYSVDWTYSIRYKILNRDTNKELYSRVYMAPAKTSGKFGSPADLAPTVQEMVLGGYDLFIRDPEVRKILDVPKGK